MVITGVTNMLQGRARIRESQTRKIYLQANVQNEWDRKGHMRTYDTDTASKSTRTGLHSFVRNHAAK